MQVHTDPALEAAVCQREQLDTDVVADKAEKAVEDTVPVDMAVDSLVFPCRPSRLLQAAKIINT